MRNNINWLNIINLITSIIAVTIPTIFFLQTSSNEIKTQTYIIFGIIVLVLLFGGFITYIISRWTNMGKDVKNTKNDLENIKKELNFKDLWNKMDVRVKVLENIFLSKRSKNGQIDPRIIFWIVLLILLYLFLKSIGIFK